MTERLRDDDVEFARWFGKSLVVDEHGDPLVVFRGEHGDSILESRLASFTFGSVEAANIYAVRPNNSRDIMSAPKLIPAFLKIENPFVNDVDDPFVDISRFTEALGFQRSVEIAKEFADQIKYTSNWEENFSQEFDSVDELVTRDPKRLVDLYANVYPFLDDPVIVRELRAKGFDGAIYGGSGETALEAEFRVFSTQQIRNAVSASKSSHYRTLQNQ